MEIDLPKLSKGFKYTGEYRRLNPGERYLSGDTVLSWDRNFKSHNLYIVVVKCSWWETIPEQGILCWVSDRANETKHLDVVLAHSYDGHYQFIASKNRYKYARPIMGEEITKFLIENN